MSTSKPAPAMYIPRLSNPLPSRASRLTGRTDPETQRPLWVTYPWDEPAILLALLGGGWFDSTAEFANTPAAIFAGKLNKYMEY